MAKRKSDSISSNKGGKRIRALRQNFDKDNFYALSDALGLIKSSASAKFDESFEVIVKLGVDPRHSDQMVRGVVSMPNGTGKDVKVAVFAKAERQDEALKAGADIVGAEDLIEKVKAGEINFDRCIATPDMMAMLGSVARVLGPRGLMPNPKLGTVTVNIADAVKAAKSGQIEFKVEKAGIVHAAFGKCSFEVSSLLVNFRAFVDAILKAKPSGAKGAYLKAIYLSSTMGPSCKVDLATISV